MNKYIFEDLDQVREQTQEWMDDYNNQRAQEALGKMAPIEYAQFNSLIDTTDKNKNYNLDNQAVLYRSF